MIKKQFNAQISRIQGSPVKINWLGFGLTYLALALGLKYFIVDKKKNKWEILKLPVITQGGEPLWPQFWKLDELKEIKNSVSNF